MLKITIEGDSELALHAKMVEVTPELLNRTIRRVVIEDGSADADSSIDDFIKVFADALKAFGFQESTVNSALEPVD